MVWNRVDEMFAQSERKYAMQKRKEERDAKFSSLTINTANALAFYRAVQSFLPSVDSKLEELTGFPCSLDVDGFYVNHSKESMSLFFVDYYEKGGELCISIDFLTENVSVSWAGNLTYNSVIPLGGLSFDGWGLFELIGLDNPSFFIHGFNSEGYISAFRNGIHSDVDHEYSMSTGRVVRWMP